jgi:hypothetical protein
MMSSPRAIEKRQPSPTMKGLVLDPDPVLVDVERDPHSERGEEIGPSRWDPIRRSGVPRHSGGHCVGRQGIMECVVSREACGLSDVEIPIGVSGRMRRTFPPLGVSVLHRDAAQFFNVFPCGLLHIRAADGGAGGRRGARSRALDDDREGAPDRTR